MIEITIREPFRIMPGSDSPQYEPGTYVLDDAIGGALMQRYNCGDYKHAKSDRTTLSDTPFANGVLFTRSGGYGDLLFLTPLLRNLKEMRPGVRIAVAAMPQYIDILRGLQYIDELLNYPLTPDQIAPFFDVVHLDNVVEMTQEGREKHMTEAFIRAAFSPSDADYFMKHMDSFRLDCPVPDSAWPAKLPRVKGRHRIGVQLQASSRCRTYPWGDLGKVMKMLLACGHELLLFYDPRINIEKEDHPRIVWVPLLEPTPTMLDAIALVKTCDAFIAPDSALCHVAGALEVPTVALYGPFPWQTRTAHAPSIHAIQGTAPCAPCHWHARRGEFPEHCPVRNETRDDKRWCIALASIEPRRIAANVRKLLSSKA